MKKVIFNSAILLFSSMLIFTACKKKTDTPAPSDDSAAQTQNGSDDSRASSESDAALNDVNAVVAGGSQTMNGARMASFVYPGATLTWDTTVATGNTVTITYDGSTHINGRTRSGSVTAHIPHSTNWKTQNAVLTLTFSNLKATFLDGKSITLNGTKTVQNVSGGDVKTLTVGTGSLVHRVRATNMTLTFDGMTSSNRSWNAARTRTITRQSATTWSISVAGDTTVGGHSNVAMWGTNRAGNTFYSIISSPVVWSNASCSNFLPISGVRVIQGLNHALTVTFGVTSSGAAEPAGTCPYGYKLDWVNDQGVSKEVIKSY